MAEYRQVHCSFWDDAFVLRLTPEEKYFYLYLMTNPKTSQCGVYEIAVRVIEFHTGYNSETVSKLIQKFEEYKKIVYDRNTEEVMLINWMQHNWINSDKVIKRIEKEIAAIKSPSLSDRIHTLCIRYRDGIDTVPEEEKRREEEKKENKKHPGAVPDKDLKTQAKAEMPPGLDVSAWARWVEYRKELRKPLKQVSIPAAQKALAAYGSQQAAVVEQSIANGWSGLFDLKRDAKSTPPTDRFAGAI